jgi:hypothetical protein
VTLAGRTSRPSLKSEERPRGPRPRSGQGERLAIVRLKFAIPRNFWLWSFTRRHPELLVEVHNTMTVEGTDTLAEFEVYGPPTDWSREIGALPQVYEVHRLGPETLPGRYQVRFRQPVYLSLAHEVGVLLRYPRTAQDGTFSCETIARVDQIHRLVSALNDSGLPAEVVSLRPEALRSCRPALTRIQRDLFRQALASGYFEVPRRTTLTALSKQISRSKSSVSRTLAVVERKLAETAFQNSGA